MKSHPSIKDARALVIGLGRSGVAASLLLSRHGARVTATDAAPEDKLSDAARALREVGVQLVVGGHDGLDFTRFDLVVISPGVPPFVAVREAERHGVPVIGEIELAWRFLPDIPVIAITGSNGKSTTVTLTGELLTALGFHPFVGGNLGEPPCEVVPQPGAVETFPYDVAVLEISSYQAERIPTFVPRRAALLNVSPNHLDRYDGFDDYVKAKGNLFVLQGAADAAVVPAGDARCVAEARRGNGQLLTFGAAADGASFQVDRDHVTDTLRGVQFARSGIRLAGEHNALNVAATLALLADRAPDPEKVRAVLADFTGLAHRIARVRTACGVTYYDDSKGTNVGASVAAIRGLSETKVVLIAGGRDKLGGYGPLVEALRARGRAAVLIGEAADRIAEAIGDAVPIVRAASMEDAVAQSARLAQPGDAVLLSPACSSFDMFRDYKHRGDAFVDAARSLPES